MSKAAELANLIGNINAGGGGVNRNIIQNGAMNIAQRTSSAVTGLGAATGVFVCDRWHLGVGTDASLGRLTMSQEVDAPSGFIRSTKLACTTADTSLASGEQLRLFQRIESMNMHPFAKGTSDAKPMAVSFYVKGNASATYVCELFDNTNSRQCSKLFNVTTDWTRVELSFPADTTGTLNHNNSNAFSLSFFLHAGATFTSGTINSSGFASASNGSRVGNTGDGSTSNISSFFDSVSRTFFVTGVQLEVGQNATSFEHRSFGEEVAICQRYYAKSYGYGTTPGTSTTSGAVFNRFNATVTNRTDLGTRFPVTMRTNPDVTPYDLQGTVDKVSDCGVGVSHGSAIGVSIVQNIGQNGFGGFTVGTGIDQLAGYHYEADAEL